MRKSTMIIAIVLFIPLIIIFASPFASSQLTSLKINSGAAQVTSDQQLICYWFLNETTNANVTWLRNGATNITQSSIACSANSQCSTNGNGNVPASFTTRGETWGCNVTYFNGTGVEFDNSSVSIINSPPTPPKVYWQNGTQTTNDTAFFPEDFTTIFNVSSSDADNDPITYTLNDTAFCSIGSSTGILTCSPTFETTNGYRSLHIGAQDSSSAQFIDFTINVTPTNDPPTFSPALSMQTVTEGHALNYIVGATDPENNLPFIFTISTNLSTIIVQNISSSTSKIVFNNSGSDIANYNDRGNWTVYVTVRDSDPSNPRNTTSSFVIQVIPINHPSSLSYIVFNNNSLIQGGNLSIYLYATDIDNDTITFSTNDNARYPINYSSATDKTNISGISSAYAWINITNMSNDYVIHHNITVSAFDTKQNSIYTLVLNITNVNDAPAINQMSYDATNTLGNINITNITAYTGVAFRYLVNASDPDTLTYQGDTLTFSTNSSLYAINSSSGLISLTPNSTGTYLVNITVADSTNAKATQIATINVFPNQAPSFTINPITINCDEYDEINHPIDCIYNISSISSDPDSGDYVADFWTNSSIFTINSLTGMIDFRPNQSTIGNYTIQVNITDTRGGINSTQMTLNIGNTNNAPNISNINIPNGRLIVGNSYQVSLTGTDLDLLLAGSTENLTFNFSAQGPYVPMFSISKITSTLAIISFDPINSSEAGNYTLNMSIKDRSNNLTSSVISIFIYNITSPPTILNISPFGSPFANNSVNTSFLNASLFPGMSTIISISENSSYTFDQNSIADQTYPNSLSYYWYYDNAFATSTGSFAKNIGFFDQGSHTVKFTAVDSFGYNVSFNWTLDVANVNRRPLLVNQLDDIIVNETTRITDYMIYANGQTKFYDPDDDPSGNGFTTGNATTLTFSATQCQFANFSFTNGDIRIKTAAIGECYENFTAFDALDPSLTAESFNVLINITGVSNDSTTTVVPVPTSSSGGGGSSTQTITIPLPVQVDTPHPLQIITPELVTVYENATVKVPILLNNTWNDTLSGITLRAYTNATNVSLYIDKTYFAKLDTGSTELATLIITNYKSEGHYEIRLEANVTDPSYHDIATIFVNSAEMQSEGDQVQSKITFARDLMSSNPECQELNELLMQSQQELDQGNYAASSRLVNDVINGCKYLVSNKSPNIQQPKEFIKTFVWKSQYNNYLIVGIFGILFAIAMYYLFRKDSTHQEF